MRSKFVSLLFLVSALAGCSSAPEASPPAPTDDPAPAVPLRLTSSAFAEGGTIPREFTCDAMPARRAINYGLAPDPGIPREPSLPLKLEGGPNGTLSYAVIFDDPDARHWLHWTFWNLAPANATLAAGASLSSLGAREGTTDFDRSGYDGPCPMEAHRYQFTLHAVDEMLDLAQDASLADLKAALDGHTLATATLNGTYDPLR